MTNGPVEVSFDVYEDFINYKQGVYIQTSGKFLGGHAVKAVGWGIDNGNEYWIIANSWGTAWGEQGFVRFGTEQYLGIEESGIAGVALIQDSVSE